MISLYEDLKMAISTIKGNRIRSFLTMLGIIIGIASVIAILAIGRGGKNVILGEFEKIGTSTVKINVDKKSADNSDYLKISDVEYIKEKSENIKYATVMISKGGICKNGNNEKNAYIMGVTEDYKYIEGAEVLYGRYITEGDLQSSRNVVVIDEGTAEMLYGYKNAIGENIYVGKSSNLHKAKIIGVTKSASYILDSYKEYIPAMVVMPISTINKIYGVSKIDSIYLLAKEKDLVDEAGVEAINYLGARHNNREKEVYISEMIMKQIEQINRVINIFTSFISAVAGISLMVGGIGVMNIMLVSVTERTREIGIRKAIGANTKSILMQFLTEAVIISLIGGVIGLVVGIAVAEVFGHFMGITPAITFLHIFYVILFSTAVGMFFGIYPAKKAAEMNPIDALRY